jgi:bis(5'-adenosyl)-triphosphatase
MPPPIPKPILFGPFTVTSQACAPPTPDPTTNPPPQVFYQTAHSFALVNLKPLLPGHVLVAPRRVVARLRDLTPAECGDLFATVTRVGRALERAYPATTALSVAVQDGADAGQSVAHVHAHVVPRRPGDGAGLPAAAAVEGEGAGDRLYRALEGPEGDVGAHLAGKVGERRAPFPRVDEAARRPRSEEEMVKEAAWLAAEMEKESVE